MNEDAQKLLIAEFDTSWQQIMNIDKRRGVFFNYANTAFFLVLTFTIPIWTKEANLSLEVVAAITILYLLMSLMAFSVKKVLESERAANVRYRKKINLIREIFLADIQDENIQKYLGRKELGIKTDSGMGNELDKVGGTLKYVYLMLDMQRYCSIALALLVCFDYLRKHL